MASIIHAIVPARADAAREIAALSASIMLEVERLREQLAHLRSGLPLSPDGLPTLARPRRPHTVRRSDAAFVAAYLRTRDCRGSCFPDGLFADPAWDMLLAIFIAAAEQECLTVSQACQASRVPISTAIRWIDLLEAKQLVRREPDPKDGRRIKLAVQPVAIASINAWLDHVRPLDGSDAGCAVGAA